MKRTLVVIHIFAVLLAAQSRRPVESTDAIIEKLRKNPADAAWINELAKRSDPQVVPVLREIFVQEQLSSDTIALGSIAIRPAQITAAALIRLGIRDDVYFEELAKYVREAIAADPPDTHTLDNQGKEDTERLNPAFMEWCAARSLESTACTSKLLSYTMDLNLLGGVQDRRAIPILHEALNASNSVIVEYAVIGLARLNDKESLPLIAKAVARFHPYTAETIIIVGATTFEDPAALPLFDRFIKDPEKRASVRKEWRERHSKAETTPDHRD